jgi:SSS family solute:Na+ symporter
MLLEFSMNSTLFLYLAFILLTSFTVLGIWYSKGKINSVEDLISSRNTIGPGATVATLISSVMGVWILFVPVEAGAVFGGLSAIIGYGIGEALPLLTYAKLGPRIRKLIPKGHSVTEYAYVRYGPLAYGLVLFVSVCYMILFLSAELTGMGGVLELIMDIPRWQSAFLIIFFVLLYTGYGGLKASIFTDTLQTILLLPLIVACAIFIIYTLGGSETVYVNVLSVDPNLLNPGFKTGLLFGFWIAIAILGAELLNQTWWQRIYSSRDDSTLKTSFIAAAFINLFIVIIAGMFGVIARGHIDLITDPSNPGYNASSAFFLLFQSVSPEPVLLVVLLLALLLTIGTADSLLNALSSIIIVDLPKYFPTPSDSFLRFGTRVIIVIMAAIAIFISIRARSVLQLFLLADLLCAAIAGPLLYGLYSKKTTGSGFILSSIIGLAVGLIYFPNAFISSIINSIPFFGALAPERSFIMAFSGAAFISSILSIFFAHGKSFFPTVLHRFFPLEDFSFERFQEEIQDLSNLDKDKLKK